LTARWFAAPGLFRRGRVRRSWFDRRRFGGRLTDLEIFKTKLQLIDLAIEFP
jgi:hypothetical protein